MGLNGRKSTNKKRETEDKNEVYRYGERKQSKRVYVCTCVITVRDSCLNPQGDNSWDSSTNTHSSIYPSLHFFLTISISLYPRPHLFLQFLSPFISFLFSVKTPSSCFLVAFISCFVFFLSCLTFLSQTHTVWKANEMQVLTDGFFL